MELTINEENLKNSDIQEFSTKVRALLFDENDKILIANYGNIILLPGGKVDDGELIITAIIRELNEELGQNYNRDELDFFVKLNYYQSNYPKRNGTFQNRLIETYYFIGQYKNIKKDLQKLTENEKKDKFLLELISLEDLENKIINNHTDNPRNTYFQNELLTILSMYKKANIKKLELK